MINNVFTSLTQCHLMKYCFMVSDLYRIKFFFKELDKSAEYLELYGVKVAVVSSSLYISLVCMLGNFAHFFVVCRSFSKIIFQKIFLQISPECQTVWIQIRPYMLSGLIWVQTVCKSFSTFKVVNQTSKLLV